MGVGGQPHAPAASTPGKDPVPILQEARWVPGPVWTSGKSRPHWDSIPDRPVRSKSPYRMSYRAHTATYVNWEINKEYFVLFCWLMSFIVVLSMSKKRAYVIQSLFCYFVLPAHKQGWASAKYFILGMGLHRRYSLKGTVLWYILALCWILCVSYLTIPNAKAIFMSDDVTERQSVRNFGQNLIYLFLFCSIYLFSRLFDVSTPSCALLTIILYSSSICFCHSSLLLLIPFPPNSPLIPSAQVALGVASLLSGASPGGG